jgi:hypothetical protein
MLIFKSLQDWRLIPGVLILWLRKTQGSSLIEAAFIFPVVLSILMGLWDMGTALHVERKLVTASKLAADLLARKEDAPPILRQRAIDASQAAMQPYDGSEIDYFIASIQFNDNGGTCPTGNDCPEVMPPVEKNNIDQSDVQGTIDSTKGLGANGEGLVMVVLRYEYEPLFSEIFTGPVTFQQAAFARGRETAYVDFL